MQQELILTCRQPLAPATGELKLTKNREHLPDAMSSKCYKLRLSERFVVCLM